ncbi:hypothetical protein [Prosthecomicrobium pneumaticum]|uniref:Uncharacterized protein n=1 Tax=Prosthecomicrobium pneumaticum TaxID=81895 RepID=A0A7W9FLC4_9HYPH|nr:hypothetical protein [Prosthecomicrobium pneumaticum]MBB5752787.1 hypothetical protein [Prosthecomicrobium pneumaticum]
MTETPDRAGPSNVRKLNEAIRKVRVAETERSDVVVELRETERARLDMLADELRGVFAEVPAEDEQFLFEMAQGMQPRLWIDVTSFVMMARDRRTYRFVKDTRLGRTVILETAHLDDMADCVTQYIAERVIERERAIEGDWLVKRIARAEEAPKPRRTLDLHATQPAPAPAPRAATAALLAAFLGGALIGILGLFAYAWMRV